MEEEQKGVEDKVVKVDMHLLVFDHGPNRVQLKKMLVLPLMNRNYSNVAYCGDVEFQYNS